MKPGICKPEVTGSIPRTVHSKKQQTRDNHGQKLQPSRRICPEPCPISVAGQDRTARQRAVAGAFERQSSRARPRRISAPSDPASPPATRIATALRCQHSSADGALAVDLQASVYIAGTYVQKLYRAPPKKQSGQGKSGVKERIRREDAGDVQPTATHRAAAHPRARRSRRRLTARRQPRRRRRCPPRRD
jgi:hypothetical protein